MKNNRRERRVSLISIGLLLMAAALLLAAYNLWDAQRAANAADATLAQIEQSIQEITAEESPEDNDTDASMEMPTIAIDGVEYIGVLEIPALDLSLPVASEWNYDNLRVSPCRYQGSAYSDDLIIAGHNYQRHFGNLKNLSAGDTVTFTDVAGNVFTFEVTEVTTLGAYAVDEMTSGDWDLTLFTCTIGGQTRVTVRCAAVENS
ncbi:MAG: sortase [Clostridiales bacterium]|nr:sortase [Clostridiales bacterium]